MKALKEFEIRFSGLKQGIHKFEFEVKDTFFTCFEQSEINCGNIKVNAEMDKKSVLLVFNLTARGFVLLPCDRCGDSLQQKINTNYTFVVKLGNEEGNGEDDVVFLSLQEYEINISQQVYEMICLAVPYQRLHAKVNCNKETVKIIKEFAPGKTDINEVDPRWEKLKELKINKKK